MSYFTKWYFPMLKPGESEVTNLTRYRLKKPEEYLNYIFKVQDIRAYLYDIFTSLYSKYNLYHPDSIRDLLLKHFCPVQMDMFTKDLRHYIFHVATWNRVKFGPIRKRPYNFEELQKNYIPKLVDYFVLFLWNRLLYYDSKIRKLESNIGNNELEYIFLNIAFHEFSVGKSLTLSAYLKCADRELAEINGIPKGVLEFEDYSDQIFKFDVDARSFKRFIIKRRIYELVNNSMELNLKILEITGSNRCSVRILDPVNVYGYTIY